MVGKQRKTCLVTLVDWKSRYLVGGKAASKTATTINKVVCEAHSWDSRPFQAYQIEERNSRCMFHSVKK